MSSCFPWNMNTTINCSFILTSHKKMSSIFLISFYDISWFLARKREYHIIFLSLSKFILGHNLSQSKNWRMHILCPQRAWSMNQNNDRIFIDSVNSKTSLFLPFVLARHDTSKIYVNFTRPIQSKISLDILEVVISF